MLPAFLRKQQINLGSSEGTPQFRPSAVAHVPWDNSIFVDRPDLLDPSVIAHEATHVWQNGHRDPGAFKEQDYDYGDVSGLEKARSDHKTIKDFSVEQQSSIVEDWYRIHGALMSLFQKQGFISRPQAEYFRKARDAYEPFIKQLAEMPAKEANWPYEHEPSPQDEADAKKTPKAPSPGLPSDLILGILMMSPEYGGSPVRIGK